MRTDPFTKESFQPMRNNQIFASAKNRIKYHNTNAYNLRKQKAFIDKPLHDNYKILKEIMNDKKELIFHKQYLLGKGFNFGVLTHIDSIDSIKYYAIYDYLFINLKDETIKILKK